MVTSQEVTAALQMIKIKYESGDSAKRDEIKTELERILKMAEGA
jgi:hypothetical protein